MPRIPMEAAFFDLAADGVCEVLRHPPRRPTRRQDADLRERGRRAVWLIDPLVRTLEVHRLDGARYRVVGAWRDAAVVRAEPFDAIDLELAVLWAD